METKQSLKNRIATTRELQSVVRTMKALAAVNIRQFQKAADAIASYRRTVELGLQIVVRDRRIGMKEAPPGLPGAVVFGSDQGMCGRFNERIGSRFEKETGRTKAVRVIALGTRLAAELARRGYVPERIYPLPGSVSRIVDAVGGVVLDIERWQTRDNVDSVVLYYNRQRGGSYFESFRDPLLPVDPSWLAALQRRSWETRVIPRYLMDYHRIFSALVRQHLFVALYRSFAESLAAENAARLAAMQAAERNVEERLRDLMRAFHRERQEAITAELLDIVAGFEALTHTD